MFFLQIGVCFVLFVSNIAKTTAFQDEEFLDGQLTLIVEDALDGGSDPVFTPRSIIHVRSVKLGSAVITHTRPWTCELTNKLKHLAENDDFYRIRVYHKGFEDNGYVSTFTKACQMYESELSETISLMVDSVGNSVSGVGLFPSAGYCQGDEVVFIDDLQHNSTVIIRAPTQAPVPDTASYIQKLESMKVEKAEGKDNRSFLAKYWMYIVPVVLIMLISGGGQDGGR